MKGGYSVPVNHRLFRRVLALLSILALAPLAPARADARSLTEWLRAQMVAQGVVDDVSLLALRELGDARLRPLFAAQATGDNVGRRMIGMLALAEMESPRRLDLLLLKNATSEGERLELVRQAAERGLLSPEDEQSLLEGGSGVGVEAWALLRSAGRGESVDPARAEAFAMNSSPAISGAGALLLLASGERAKGNAALDALLPPTTDSARARVADLLRTAARHNIDAAADFALRTLEASGDDAALAAEAVGALLALRPERGVKEWVKRYDASKQDFAGRIRLGLIALERLASADESVAKRLQGESSHALLRAMGSVIRARSGDGLGAALSELARERHGPSLAWMVYQAERSSGPAWVEGLAAIASLDTGSDRLGPAMQEMCVRAASLLFERSPERALASLDESLAAREARWAQTVLLGALRGGRISAGVGERAVGWPDSETEALATILRARDAEKPDPAAAERLERIAFGWGGVSRGRRVQAAWLSLVHLGRERAALADLLTRQ